MIRCLLLFLLTLSFQAFAKETLTDASVPSCYKVMQKAPSAANPKVAFKKLLDQFDFAPIKISGRTYETSYSGKNKKKFPNTMPAHLKRYSDLKVSLENNFEDAQWLKWTKQCPDNAQENLSVLHFLPKFAQTQNNRTAYRYSTVKAMPQKEDDFDEFSKTIYVDQTFYPNCFSAIFDAYGLNSSLNEHFPSYKVTKALENNFDIVPCGETVNFGDVMMIYRVNDDLLDPLHGNLVINKDFVWGKASTSPEDPWTFEAIDMKFADFYHGQGGFNILGLYQWKEKNNTSNLRVLFWKKK